MSVQLRRAFIAFLTFLVFVGGVSTAGSALAQPGPSVASATSGLETVDPTVLPENAAVIVIGGTMDPTSKGVAYPATWDGYAVHYPASVPIVGPMVGQPTYDDSVAEALKDALKGERGLRPGVPLIIIGGSQGGDAAVQLAQLVGPTITVTVGAPNGDGALAGMIPDLPGTHLSQATVGSDDYHIRQVIRGDGIAAPTNPLEGGTAPLGTAACVLGYMFYHLGMTPDENYGKFRLDEVRKTSDGEIWVMNATHPFVKAAGLLGIALSDQQKQEIEQIAPLATPGVKSSAPTPRDLLQPTLPNMEIPLVTDASAPIADPISQAAEVLNTAWNDVTTSTVQAVEAWANNAPAPAAAVNPEPAPVADPITQAIQVFNDAGANLQVQADQFLAGLPHL